MRRNAMKIALLLAETSLNCSSEQVITPKKVERHEISDDDVAGLCDRLATGRLKKA